MTDVFRFPIRVYYEDTDCGGVVYHAQYVCFLERARTEWLRAQGLHQSELVVRRDLLFAVAGMELKFRLPARLDDALTATCVLAARRGASLEFRQQLVRDADNALLVEARVRAACLRASDFRPQAIPDDLILK